MSNLAIQNQNNDIVSYDSAMVNTLRASLFPGAKVESVVMVIEYCRHAKLDIMLKPVHIVPMWIVDKETGQGEMRDVIMPGINSYRIKASRSGCAGISEPEFGEDVTECIGGADTTYPKWCRVTVKRIIAGRIVEFTAKEYWKENYANSGKDKATKKVLLQPNAMWSKRPYGQLAKCAEAQALRKAFPEIGSMPTAEEMEGKHLDSQEFEDMQKQKFLPGKGVQGLKAKLGMIVEPETGEVLEGETVEEFEDIDPTEKSSAPTVNEVIGMINKATSIDDLILAADLARAFTPKEQAIIKNISKNKEATLK